MTMKLPLYLSIKRLHALSDIVVVKVTPIVQSSTFFLPHGEDLKILALLALWQFLYTVTCRETLQKIQQK